MNTTTTMREFNLAVELFDLATNYRFDRVTELETIIGYARDRWGSGQFGVAAELERLARSVGYLQMKREEVTLTEL